MAKGDHIKYQSGYKYQLVETYETMTGLRPEKDIITKFIHLYRNGLLRIICGYAWDGASGPTVDTKSSIRGSLAHDALYQLMRDGLLDHEIYRKLADQEFEKICLEDGMWFLRARVWEAMVRKFAEPASEPKNAKPVLIAP